MKYRILDVSEHDRWDVFVSQSPQGSIYAKAAYLTCLGCAFKVAIAEKNGLIRGGLVLTRNEVGVFSNPLMAKYLGILYAPDVDTRRETYSIDRLLIDAVSSGTVWSYNFHPGYTNWLVFHWKGFRQTTRYTYQIDFASREDIASRYSEKVKAPLRAAKKACLTMEDLEPGRFLDFFCKALPGESRKPRQKKEVLKRSLGTLEDGGFLKLAGIRDTKGNIHAVAALIWDNGSANLVLNRIHPGFRKFGGNTLLLDGMIRFAAGHCRIFDFEGSMHERIERFYRGFGGRRVSYFHIYRANVWTWAYLGALSLVKRFYK